MHRHLIPIEICIKCGTDQGMQTNRLTFDQFWLKGLNTQSVKGRGTVQQYRMPFQNVFKDVPHYRLLFIYNFLGGFYCLDNSALDQLTDDKRLCLLYTSPSPRDRT